MYNCHIRGTLNLSRPLLFSVFFFSMFTQFWFNKMILGSWKRLKLDKNYSFYSNCTKSPNETKTIAQTRKKSLQTTHTRILMRLCLFFEHTFAHLLYHVRYDVRQIQFRRILANFTELPWILIEKKIAKKKYT